MKKALHLHDDSRIGFAVKNSTRGRRKFTPSRLVPEAVLK